MSAVPEPTARSIRVMAGGVSLPQLYVGRAILAILWAAAFLAVDSRLSPGAKVLVVAYPAIDVIASLIDSRSEQRVASGSVQLINAVVSLAALIGLAIAVGSNQGTVLHVFGSWATVSGLIQLSVAFRRRSEFGLQPAMLVSGALSTVAGITFNLMATSHDPKVSNLAGYAGIGALLFLVAAFRLRPLRLRR
jgi:uncharacterized membrane protein HdeD (DUF308 family)